MRSLCWLCGAVCLIASSAMAQDPVKVDPKHYKVEFENAQVRVLRIRYGPHEKSVMHDHPDSVAVLLGELNTKFPMASPHRAQERRGRPSGRRRKRICRRIRATNRLN